MIKIIILSVLLTPATALAWRYVVFEDDTLSYDGPLPPVDISYPPLGEPTPTMPAGALQEGEILAPDQVAEQRLRPHVVIIPPVETQGNKISTQVTPTN